jgi:hypothetical protein
VELGVTDWSITEGGSSFGPTIAVEVTPIENWLELEAGVTPLFRTAIANHLEPLQYLRAALPTNSVVASAGGLLYAYRGSRS